MPTTLARSPRTRDLRVQRPTDDVVVVRAAGDLDLLATPEFTELVTVRLASAGRGIVVDLSQVSFLSVAALQVLAGARLRAQARGMTFGLVTGPPCVASALRAGGLLGQVETFPSQAAALDYFS